MHMALSYTVIVAAVLIIGRIIHADRRTTAGIIARTTLGFAAGLVVLTQDWIDAIWMCGGIIALAISVSRLIDES
jgi:uncharacterized membrane protein YecN with MAPEG domain